MNSLLPLLTLALDDLSGPLAHPVSDEVWPDVLELLTVTKLDLAHCHLGAVQACAVLRLALHQPKQIYNVPYFSKAKKENFGR